MAVMEQLNVGMAVRRRLVVEGYSETGSLVVPRLGRGVILLWSYSVSVVPAGTVDEMAWVVQRQSSGVRIEEAYSQFFGPVPVLAEVHVSVGFSEAQVGKRLVRVGWPALYALGTEEVTILAQVPSGSVAVSAGTLTVYHWPDFEGRL